MELSAQESAVLIYLKDRNEVNEREMRIEKLSSDNIRGAISWLEKKGLINVKIVDAEELELSGEGQKYLKEGLPELRVLSLLKKKKRISIKEIQGELGESESKIAIAQLAKLGIKPSKGELEYISGKEQEQIILREMGVLESIWKKDLSILPEYKDEKEALLRRSGIVERKVRSSRIVSINEAGRKNLAAMEESTDSIGELTAEMIRAGTWRDKRFRPYDLNLPGKSVKRRGLHPMTAIINDVRQIFLSMGFEELKDGYVEFAGWNMDSLFIPQDHPARDMQDTFFLEPAKQVEPDRAERILFGKSGKIHEKGMSGYSGWGYKWQPEEAE
ncbi:MAG: phenylalanine--tRNA ligase subunit alpha, partial [Candidatus Thermoplasmatota archaeon]|nr:phenylalanine--tRNA ligase subunit alpha [Candidatus Thermoplasmatota archaeon]